MPIENRIIPLDELLPDTRNPRQHSAENIARLVSRIQAVGFTSPVLVDANTRTLAAGHRRRLALHWMREHSFPEPSGIEPGWGVPCRVGEWSELQALQVLLGDNGLADELTFDDAALASLLADLQQQGALEGAGYDDAALDRLIGELAAGAGSGDGAGESGLLPDADVDAIPEQVETRCQAGDLWCLGVHRLAVGDCTDPATVARLLEGSKADVVLSDPPYGQDIGYGRGELGHRFVAGDADTGILAEAFVTIELALKKDAHCLIWIQWRTYPELVAAFSNYRLKTVVVWDKCAPGLGAGIADQHEWLCVFIKGQATQSEFCGNVWREAREGVGERNPHPTMKPVEILGKALKLCSVSGDLVFDGFLGSGSTLIAAESLGRRCYGLEIEPRYADLCLARWEACTGRTAELLQRAPTELREAA